MQTESQTADYQAVTDIQRAMWASGDSHQIARQNVVIAEALCQAADPHGGQRVLDVACGSGTAALVVARRYCEVTGIDYVPALIERAKVRATAAGFCRTERRRHGRELRLPTDMGSERRPVPTCREWLCRTRRGTSAAGW
jgi:tRNA/tmRNA/rRNA uracil-C5-methylase (TrmA/RlmC/RlmD family)